MQHLSLLTAGWSYIPAGMSFGYLLMLPVPLANYFGAVYAETMFWPFVVAVITLIVSVALTNGLKLNYRKCQFVHLYVQLAAMVFYLGAGLVFLLSRDVVPAVYLAACGLGLTLAPGLSYVHIRAPGRWRSLYMGLCYFWFLAGIGATATIFLVDATIWVNNSQVDATIHTNMATCMLAAAAFIIVLLGVNEMLQREGIVDYKKPLDFDTDIAHESGKLFGRREVTNLYNNFSTTTAAAMTLGNGVGSKQWNSSTEQIVSDGRGAGAGGNYHKLWVFLMIFTKLQGFIAFYWVFVVLSIEEIAFMFPNYTSGYAGFWFMALGSLTGVFLMIFVNNKIIYLVSSFCHTVGLILVIAFYYTDADPVAVGASFLVFYTFIGASLAIPAINILELSPLNFNETFLAIGFIMELIGIALMQYFAVTDVSIYGFDPEAPGRLKENWKDVLAAHFIPLIVVSVILQVIVLWHMPNTFGKSLAEINADLSRMTSYFAFRRTMTPAIMTSNGGGHGAMNRAFTDESIASEQLEIEEKQLSTRNGHLMGRRFNDQSDDSTAGRRSPPYNDFSDNTQRYQRRTIIEHRDMSPTPERDDDPYLQEQLQRQHERNYILPRQQQLYQQQSRHSPEPQQYNYRHAEHPHLQPQRYNSDFDDHSLDRAPRSLANANQNAPNRGGPPPLLLSRQQYYEQYQQDRLPPPPAHKPPSVRQTPTPPPKPAAAAEQLPPLARRPQHSQTVKSEPGYVMRPRLETQQSNAPAPPPLPPADYLTKSLPRINPERQQRAGLPESIHPVLIPKPTRPQEEVIPGVEYAHNLRPSEFLRQNRQSKLIDRNAMA